MAAFTASTIRRIYKRTDWQLRIAQHDNRDFSPGKILLMLNVLVCRQQQIESGLFRDR